MDGVSEEKDIKLLEKIEYLNGFLYGLSICDGKLNQFYNRLFLLKPSEAKIIDKINEFLLPGGNFKVEKEKQILGWAEWRKALELGLRDYIIIDPCGDTRQVEKLIQDRKRYISFKIMDMLEFMKITSMEDTVLTIIDASSESYLAKFFVLTSQDKNTVLFFSKKK